MPATLDLNLTQRLTGTFLQDDWKTFSPQDCFSNRNGRVCANWSSTSALKDVGGVYAILLPTGWFEVGRTLHLHAPARHRGERIPFEFTLRDDTGDRHGVVYVGKTANLASRWRGHLNPGARKDGGQVKYGLVDCGVAEDVDSALQKVRTHAKIIYTVLPGQNTAPIETFWRWPFAASSARLST